jgi:hypothetical protein
MVTARIQQNLLPEDWGFSVLTPNSAGMTSGNEGAEIGCAAKMTVDAVQVLESGRTKK